MLLGPFLDREARPKSNLEHHELRPALSKRFQNKWLYYATIVLWPGNLLITLFCEYDGGITLISGGSLSDFSQMRERCSPVKSFADLTFQILSSISH